MIYDRHEDIAARPSHPAIVRHRTGVTATGGSWRRHRGGDGRRRVLHAHARCPLARRAPRRRSVPLPERAAARPGDADQHAADGAFRGFGAPRPSSPPETQLNRLAEALNMSPAEIRRRNVYRLNDTTPTGQVLRGERRRGGVLEQALGASLFDRVRERTGREAAERRGSGRSRGRAPVG